MYAIVIDEIYFLDSRTTKNFKKALSFINFFFQSINFECERMSFLSVKGGEGLLDQWRIQDSQTGGGGVTPELGQKPIIWQQFCSNCMKMKKIDREVERVPSAPGADFRFLVPPSSRLYRFS